jgi:hypothetical protein
MEEGEVNAQIEGSTINGRFRHVFKKSALSILKTKITKGQNNHL